MTGQAWIVTVGAARLSAADDPAGSMVARALLAEGLPVASRQIVDDDLSGSFADAIDATMLASAGLTSAQPRVFRPQSGLTQIWSAGRTRVAFSSKSTISCTDGMRGE